MRKALGLSKLDKISYSIRPDGSVLMSRANTNEDDPVLGEFLAFLAQDIKHNPKQVKALSTELFNKVQGLVSGVDVDLDAPLSEEDD